MQLSLPSPEARPVLLFSHKIQIKSIFIDKFLTNS